MKKTLTDNRRKLIKRKEIDLELERISNNLVFLKKKKK